MIGTVTETIAGILIAAYGPELVRVAGDPRPLAGPAIVLGPGTISEPTRTVGRCLIAAVTVPITVLDVSLATIGGLVRRTDGVIAVLAAGGVAVDSVSPDSWDLGADDPIPAYTVTVTVRADLDLTI